MRSRGCGLYRYTRHPSLLQTTGTIGHAWWDGVIRCRARVCPVCHVARKMKVLREVNYVAAERGSHTRARPLMATLTVRHAASDAVGITKQVRACWRKFLQGRDWQAFKAQEYGGLEWIAAEEITHGANGWHPHMHVLLLPQRERAPLDEEAARTVDMARAWWVADRWRDTVARVMGEQHRPDWQHGSMLHRCANDGGAAYIAKLAWELTDATGGKSAIRNDGEQLARRGRSALDLLLSSDTADHDRYLALCAARHRQRDLTYSTGLRLYRDAFEDVPTAEPETVVTIRGSDYERMKHQRGEEYLLELALAKAREDVLALLTAANVEPMSAEELDAERREPARQLSAAIRGEPEP